MKADNMIAYLLSEETTMSVPQIQKDDGKSVSIYTTLQSCDIENRNGRIYPLRVVKGGIEDSVKIQELIRRKQWFGECEHPFLAGMDKKTLLARQQHVKAENRSHRIMNVDFVGNLVKGTVKTAPTARGKEMRDLILDNEGMEAAFSLRAIGPVSRTNKGLVVRNPIHVVTYDWVSFPSHEEAYQERILTESAIDLRSQRNKEYAIPIYEGLNESVVDFIKHESENYKLVTKCMEANIGAVTLTGDNKNILIESVEGHGVNSKKNRILVNIEDAVSKEYMSYMNSFRK